MTSGRRLTQDFVRETLNGFGCDLVGKYVDANTNINVLCICGHLRITKFHYIIRSNDTHLCEDCSKNRERIIIDDGEIRNRFEKLGYIILDNEELKHTTDKINIMDSERYKYRTSVSELESNFSRNNSLIPRNRFVRANPYTLYNIDLWMEKNNVNRYYIKERKEYVDNTSKTFLLVCNNCGEEWDAYWADMMSGRGCPFCAIPAKRFSRKNSFGGKFPEILLDWDYSKNGDIDPYKISSNSQKKVFWKCLKCGKGWPAVVINRTKLNRGCPFCASSKGNKFIGEFLSNNSVCFIPECSRGCRNINPLPFDFYLPDYNLAIEYQGIQHYEPIDFGGNGKEWAKERFIYIQKNDSIKEQYCLDNGIPLLKIKYTDFDKIPEILTSYLNL